MADRITRRHSDGGRRSTAVFSRCGVYRYALTREWGQGRRIAFVMLNPSVADHRRNDPTIARCESRARDLGATGYRIVNLFAFRATYPQELRGAADPVGPGNDATIRRAAAWADLVICAWGADGALLDRGAEVARMLRRDGYRLCHFGLTKNGAPRHPLYLPRALQPSFWD
ncbi:hypothetical protein SAMN04487972_105129 [Paracoccus halophilus]|uniref:DUF1643 domain-containing protein n=1 Tax=Paracoccus halophilus TaxID=376733 RepID=A0A099F5E3_9RHOB|nr:DUF1643 domain-containing protein [Paracoccus halophilus]KGJ05659.1 hypothetical protein IT41_05495 [Paracoccus halophilus]SFA47758.1 hypothetical protein SAMN04487972_105129 [Paracoccus halophilus]